MAFRIEKQQCSENEKTEIIISILEILEKNKMDIDIDDNGDNFIVTYKGETAANYIMIPLKNIQEIADDMTTQKIDLFVLKGNTKYIVYDLTVAQIKKIDIDDIFGLAAGFHCKDEFRSEQFNLFRALCTGVGTVTAYDQMGFIEDSNRLIFLTGNETIGASNEQVRSTSRFRKFKFKYDKNISVTDTVKFVIEDVLSIANSGMMSFMICFMLLSLSTYLIRQVDDTALSFMTILLGRTGSFKTTIAEFIFNIYGRVQRINFEASKAAINNKLCLIKDATLFIDDMHPETTQTALKVAEDKQEGVARAIGDGGILPAKATIGGSESERSTFALPVLSGEILSSNNQSTLARSAIVNLNASDFDKQKLKYCTKNKTVYNSFIYHYIAHIIKDKNYTQRVYEKFSSHQDEIQNLYPGAHPRTFSNLAWIMAAYDEFINFANLNYSFADGQLDLLSNEFKHYLDEIGKKSALVNQNLDEATLFLQAILYLEANNSIVLRRVEKGIVVDDDASKCLFVGYSDEEAFYLKPSIFDQVVKYYKSAGKTFSYSPEQIRSRLYELGILVKDPMEKNLLTSRESFEGKRGRYTVLRHSRVNNFLNREENSNE